jgi:hypothetical protein
MVALMSGREGTVGKEMTRKSGSTLTLNILKLFTCLLKPLSIEKWSCGRFSGPCYGVEGLRTLVEMIPGRILR